jgi:long-chain fatty acid transport protein
MNKVYWLAVAAIAALSASAPGAGFQLYTEGSAEALGQGGAISGRDDLVSLAWYNPAALAGAEQPSIMAGSTFVKIKASFDSALSPLLDASAVDDWHAVPHFYYVQPVSGDWTALLSVNAPYGLVTEWPDGWAGSIAAVYSELKTIYTTPSLAYRINDRVAISAGLNVVYAAARLTASRDFSALPGPDFGEREVRGDDFGCGYTASAHWNIADEWAAGARFQSRVKVNLEGEVEFDLNPLSPGSTEFDGSAELILPASVNIGVVNKSLRSLQLGFDLVWSEWSSYDALIYEFGAGYPVTALTPNPEVVPKRWDNVWSTRLGGEYELNETWALRAGYVWDQSPAPNETRAPELPDADRQMVMAGVGWKGNNMGVDLAYSYLWAKKSTTGAEVVALVPTTAGEYEGETHLVALSVSYAF